MYSTRRINMAPKRYFFDHFTVIGATLVWASLLFLIILAPAVKREHNLTNLQLHDVCSMMWVSRIPPNINSSCPFKTSNDYVDCCNTTSDDHFYNTSTTTSNDCIYGCSTSSRDCLYSPSSTSDDYVFSCSKTSEDCVCKTSKTSSTCNYIPTASDNCVYKPENFIGAIVNNRVCSLSRNSSISVKICSRNTTALIPWNRGLRIKAPMNESADPCLTGWGVLFYSYIHESWRHMFSHHCYLLNETGQCLSSSLFSTYWGYIVNFYHRLLSTSILSNVSYFGRYVLRWCGGATLRGFLFNAVVLAGLHKLRAWHKPRKQARGDRSSRKIATSRVGSQHTSGRNLKSWQHHYNIPVLKPLHSFIHFYQLKSHPGFEEDRNCEVSSKNTNSWDGEGDAGGSSSSSYLKQFYTSPCVSRTFRPQPVQIRVAPVQYHFLPNPTMNPDIDLAYVGYRIATLGALSASFPVSLSRLAEAGFYFRGQGDEMTCYSCGVRFSGWTSNDDPMTVHRRLAPHCRHVVNKDQEAQGLAGTAGMLPSTARVLNEGGNLGGGEGPENRPSSAALSSLSSSQWTEQRTSQATLSGASEQRTTTSDAALLNGHISGGTTETVRSTATSTETLVRGHAEGRTSGVMTASSSASQPASSSVSSHSSPRTSVSRTVPETSTAPSSDGASETPLFPRAGLALSDAVYPMFQDMASRRRSFQQCRWDDTRAPPLEEVIMCGMFYAGYADCVRCFFCGVGLKHWMPADDVWREHVRWRPHCGYLRTIKTEEFFTNIQRQLGIPDSDGRPGNARQVAGPGPSPASINTNTTTAAPTSTSTVAAAASLPRAQSTATNVQLTGMSATTISIPQSQSSHLAPSNTTTATSNSQTTTAQAAPPTTTATSVPQSQNPSTLPSSATTATSSSRTTTAQATPTTTAQATPTTTASVPQTFPRSSTPLSSSSSTARMTSTSAVTSSVNLTTTAREEQVTPRSSDAASRTADGHESSGRAVTPVRGAVVGDRPRGPGDDSSHGNQRDAANGRAVSAPNAEDDLQRRERLQDENRRLAQRFQCRVCHVARVNCIFLPCGHLVACEPCAQSLTSCLLCHANVRATARVHMT